MHPLLKISIACAIVAICPVLIWVMFIWCNPRLLD